MFRPGRSFSWTHVLRWNPSTVIVWPVMKFGSTVARNATTWPMSSGVPKRPRQIPFKASSVPAASAELMVPGQIAFTAMEGASSFASERVMPSIPAFEAA